MLKPVVYLSTSTSQSESNSIQLVGSGSQLVEVEGRTLEGQFVNSAGELLLVLTDDCPFEETLRLVLLSPDLDVIDSLEFASPYDSFVVQQVSAMPDNQIQIQVNNQQCFDAELLDRPMSLSAQLAAKCTGHVVSQKKRITLTF